MDLKVNLKKERARSALFSYAVIKKIECLLTQDRIIRIMKDNSVVRVYNLEVNRTHNYFAEGCVVHNKPVQIDSQEMPGPNEPTIW